MSKEIKCFGRCWTRRQFLKAIGGVAVGTVALTSGIVVLRGKKSVYELGQDKVVEYQKLTRRKRPTAPWISALAIALLVSLIAYVSALLTGGVSQYGYRTIAFGAALIFTNLIIAKSTFDRTFAALQEKLLDGLESDAGLPDLYLWLAAAGDIKIPVLLGLLIWIANVAFLLPEPTENPVETIIVGVIMFLWTGFIVYYMLLFVVMPLRLSHCQFKLHTEDPVSTEVLDDWSKMMNFVAYMFALMLATGTLFTITAVTFTKWAHFRHPQMATLDCSLCS